MNALVNPSLCCGPRLQQDFNSPILSRAMSEAESSNMSASKGQRNSTFTENEAEFPLERKAIEHQMAENGQHEEPDSYHASACAAPPSIFHLFPRLPFELRREIWIYALPGPRLIEVCAVESKPCYAPSIHGTNPNYRRRAQFGKFFEVGRNRVPAILRVCHESREIALESYEYCLSTIPNPSTVFYSDPSIVIPHEEMRGKGVLFQPERDTIFFRWSDNGVGRVLQAARGEIKTDNIRSVALDDEMFHTRWRALFVGFNGCPPLLYSLDKLFLLVGEKIYGDFSSNRKVIASPTVLERRQEFIRDRIHADSIEQMTILEMRNSDHWDTSSADEFPFHYGSLESFRVR